MLILTTTILTVKLNLRKNKRNKIKIKKHLKNKETYITKKTKLITI